MTPVIGVIVIVEITCQLPIAVALVPLTNSDRGEGSSARPPDDFSSDNKECRASDNLPVTVECGSERVGQIVVIHFDKDSKTLWSRRRIIKINESACTSFVWGFFGLLLWGFFFPPFPLACRYARVVKNRNTFPRGAPSEAARGSDDDARGRDDDARAGAACFPFA